MRVWLLVACVAACGGKHGDEGKQDVPAAKPAPVAPTPMPAPNKPAAATIDAGVAIDAAAAAAKPAAGGEDFIAEAKLLYRIAACGGSDALPASYDKGMTAIVDAHCKDIQKRATEYHDKYFVGAREFFDSIEPKDIPSVVVYPFGGGDLLSALAAFPNATEITTISLELAGDPRRIDTLTSNQLSESLGALRVQIGGLLSVGSNTSVNLSDSQQNDLPGQVSSFLMGLATGGYEPVSMRYFHLDADGAIKYYEKADIEAIEAGQANQKKSGAHASSRKGDWASPNFSEAFANVEIQYRKIGDTQVRVHRHFGWNLGDDYLGKHPELIKHLSSKGKVTMLTKGASYLLWTSEFKIIRDYMLSHLAWMLSDSTGIPPAYANAAGMVQDTYGNYDGAFLEGSEEHGKKNSDDFRALWRKNKHHPLKFRFGYVDAQKQAHLVVTRPAGAN